MMLYRFISYLCFLSSSTNHHGVHSPFIYGYVSKGLYAKSNAKASKTYKVLFNSIAYFKARNIYLSSNTTLITEIINRYPAVQIGKPPYDLVYLSYLKKAALLEIIHGAVLHNDTLILIKGIHHSKENTALWKEIKTWKEVKVSIDMFHCGAIFIRKDQVKEHFKIRI